MKWAMGAALAAAMAAGTTASAVETLQMDINGFQVQVKDAAGNNSAFGGLSHTGSIDFSTGPFAVLNSIAISQTGIGGEFVDQGFSGTLASFGGFISLVNGQVTGGELSVTVDSGDTYTADISGSGGKVSPFVGGGFKLESMTFDGLFTDALFGNVDISNFFNIQDQGLFGSLLQFNFDPNANGAGFSDMDLFVLVPLPPAGWAGLATLAGVMTMCYVRRRK